jgi:hypothetical protein
MKGVKYRKIRMKRQGCKVKTGGSAGMEKTTVKFKISTCMGFAVQSECFVVFG